MEVVFCCASPVPNVRIWEVIEFSVASSSEVFVLTDTDPPATLEFKSKSTAVSVPRSELKSEKLNVVLLVPIVGVAL